MWHEHWWLLFGRQHFSHDADVGLVPVSALSSCVLYSLKRWMWDGAFAAVTLCSRFLIIYVKLLCCQDGIISRSFVVNLQCKSNKPLVRSKRALNPDAHEKALHPQTPWCYTEARYKFWPQGTGGGPAKVSRGHLLPQYFLIAPSSSK